MNNVHKIDWFLSKVFKECLLYMKDKSALGGHSPGVHGFTLMAALENWFGRKSDVQCYRYLEGNLNSIEELTFDIDI